ncbi:MAG: MFS transporter [Gammaproteobacteria bacterium]|nr:MFS transporter [Gammaproteobacteria bacterium]
MNAGDSFSFRSNAYAWYVVAILSLSNINAYLDRMIINLLVEPIRLDLGVTDTQISLLQGLAFALFYSVMLVPIGRLADARSRKKVIAIGMVFWSMATVLCGLARTYLTLFMARAMVGAGEASLTPSAFSMISDYFPRRMVTRAISVFTGSGFIGSGVALLIGAAVVGLVTELGEIEMPLIGTMYPWQLAFVIVSVPGFILAALIWLTVREPPRQTNAVDAAGAASGLRKPEGALPVKEVGAFLKGNARSVGSVIVGFSIIAMVTFGFGAWVPTYFVRTFEFPISDIGYIYGLYFVVFGSLGVLSGGWLSDFLYLRGVRDSNLRVGIIGAGLAAPLIVIFALVDNHLVALGALAIITFLLSMPFGAGPAALPMIVPNQARAQIVALFLLSANLVGQGVGPTSIALVTDYVFADPAMLRYSLAVVCPALLVFAMIVIWSGLKPFRARMLAVEASAKTPASGSPSA